jgi:hypothetical protein
MQIYHLDRDQFLYYDYGFDPGAQKEYCPGTGTEELEPQELQLFAFLSSFTKNQIITVIFL